MEPEEKSQELRAKLNESKSFEEVIELAKSVGISLTDEQLDAINGGGVWSSNDSVHTATCSYCGSKIKFDSKVPGRYVCSNCESGWITVYEDGVIGGGSHMK